MINGTNMREVVQTLRANDCQAALELLELAHTLTAILSALVVLAPGVQELRSTFAGIFVVNDADNIQRVESFCEQASRVNDTAVGLLGALGEVCKGVERWDLGELHGPTVEPAGAAT